ncbi:pentatricopeptide repeat-containing protein At5g14080 isoform X2 [Cynara cardunculus var. scolymus]|uniref:pentatricopeptide repeat-containing protein At5g14080 isoform X2 n=1 Tax=Cynara cardunculus var. scolymus TaxID=59895 RepID=UPI000D625871|nr:pentatricopeptide repeat-containing protein At5g14080 isoform X2 [Cynara cardunculus var. scolymus]
MESVAATPSTHHSFPVSSILSLSITLPSHLASSTGPLSNQVKTLNIQLHPSLYRSLIASNVAGKKALNAFSVFNHVRCLIPDIGDHTCNSLVAALSSARNMGYAQQVFDEMTTRGVRVSTLGFGVFIWRFCITAELDKTLCLLDDVRRQDSGVNGSIVALLVVHGLCSASRVFEAMYMLDVLRKRDCKPDFMAYRIVAEALRATGNVVDVEKVLKMKRKLGVAPRASDYRDFIFQLISERLICEAKDLGEVIVNGNFPIEDDVLNALIGSVSTEDPCSALMFFKFLVSRERLPTLLTFTNLSRNLCRHEKHDELVQVYKILSWNQYFVDIERYHVMVSSFCKAGKVKEAYQVLQEMKKEGVGPDISSYNLVMEACCREDLVRPAKRLWDEMFANGCEANLKTYNILISKLSKIGQVKEAHRLFCHMLERGLQPDATTYGFLLEGLCQENQLETAFEVFKKSFEQDAVIAKDILREFILYLVREGQYMAASNLVHDYTTTIGHSESNMMLLKCLVDAGEVVVAIEHMKRVGEMWPSMLNELHAELLSWFTSSPKPQPILEFIQAIEGLQQNHVVSNTLPK